MFFKKTKKKSLGGIPFFITLVSLVYLSLTSAFILPYLVDSYAKTNLIYFFSGIGIGYLTAAVFLTGHFSVFIHELEHSIVSSLVGNKYEAMEIKENSGHFRYSYTKDTAKFNALISLAPYFLPLFTFISLIFYGLVYFKTGESYLIILGIGYGMDFIINVRDISPIQTDLTDITGGYKVAISFIIAINLTILSFILAYVMQGKYGFVYLYEAHFSILTEVYYLIRGT